MSTQPNEQPSLRAEHIHPKHAGFMLIMAGPLLQWPTLLTLIMFPILITMYVRLGRCKEREVLSEFGEYMPCMPQQHLLFFRAGLKGNQSEPLDFADGTHGDYPAHAADRVGKLSLWIQVISIHYSMGQRVW